MFLYQLTPVHGNVLNSQCPVKQSFLFRVFFFTNKSLTKSYTQSLRKPHNGLQINSKMDLPLTPSWQHLARCNGLMTRQSREREHRPLQNLRSWQKPLTESSFITADCINLSQKLFRDLRRWFELHVCVLHQKTFLSWVNLMERAQRSTEIQA